MESGAAHRQSKMVSTMSAFGACHSCKVFQVATCKELRELCCDVVFTHIQDQAICQGDQSLGEQPARTNWHPQAQQLETEASDRRQHTCTMQGEGSISDEGRTRSENMQTLRSGSWPCASACAVLASHFIRKKRQSAYGVHVATSAETTAPGTCLLRSTACSSSVNRALLNSPTSSAHWRADYVQSLLEIMHGHYSKFFRCSDAQSLPVAVDHQLRSGAGCTCGLMQYTRCTP